MKQLILTILFLPLIISNTEAQFAGGSGTEEDPYQIADIEQLQAIANSSHLDKYFIQIADIDASDTENWSEGEGFIPVGNETGPFTGSYDSGTFKILNLTINRSGENFVGLFGYVGNGVIKNVSLENVSVAGRDNTGALAGYHNGTIEHSNATGTVTGMGYVGGLTGYNTGKILHSFSSVDVTGIIIVGGLAGAVRFNAEISDSYSDGNVNAESHAGGLVGMHRDSEINQSRAVGDVSGESRIGGLIGQNSPFGKVNDSYATGNVTGDDEVGGLIGRNMGTVNNSYASGSVSGVDRVGGLAGYSRYDGEINSSWASGVVSGETRVGGLVGGNTSAAISYSYSHGQVTGITQVGGLAGSMAGIATEVYATGNVTGSEDVGGLFGYAHRNTEIRAAYWDHDTSDPSTGVGNGSQIGTRGLSTTQMKGQEAFIYMHRLDFDQKWLLVEDYPVLAWQDPEDALDAPEVALITVDPPVYDFGEVELDQSASWIFTLTNAGNTTMNGEVMPLDTNIGVFEITGGEGNWTLEPSESHAVEVVFYPSSEDTFQTVLEIGHNAANEEDPLDVLINGTGINLQFAGGSGTESDPYEVSTLTELHKVRYFPDAWFVQTAGIHAEETSEWNDGKGFNPIGWWESVHDNAPFTGVYYGNGFSISGLYIDRDREDAVGLFGYIENAVIKNVVLTDGNITGMNHTSSLVGNSFGNNKVLDSHSTANVSGSTSTGGLIGFFFRGEIDGSYAAGPVSGSSDVGGLAGTVAEGAINNSHAMGDILGRRTVGGLVGYSLGPVRDSYATGEVTGEEDVGGLAGHSSGGIHGSYATGDVSGTYAVGGLVGHLGGAVNYSYARGRVSGEEYVGGLVGVNQGNVRESYSTGEVSGLEYAGGLIGNFEGSLTEAYWNVESSGQALAVAKGDQSETEGLTTAEMTGDAAEIHMKRLTFGERWLSVSEDYPRHLWQILPEISFFKVTIDEAPASMLEGQLFELIVTVDNMGGVSGDQTIELRDNEGQLVDAHTGVTLEGGDQTTVTLTWQTGEGDKGDYDFVVRSENHTAIWKLQVYPGPAKVVLESPVNEASEVDDLPVFTWNKADNSDLYAFQLSTDSDFTGTVLDTLVASDTTLTLPEPLEPVTEYWWRIGGVNDGGRGEWSDTWTFVTAMTTGIPPESTELPEEVTIRQNYPNPFNPVTMIPFELPERIEVRLEVYDLLGRRVAELTDRSYEAGRHEVSWDASDMASGVYLVRMLVSTDQGRQRQFNRQVTLVK